MLAYEQYTQLASDVYRYTHTWLTNDEFEEWLEFRKNSSFEATRAKVPNCECYYSIYCFFTEISSCNSGGCTVGGSCGVMGTTDCTGTC